MIRCDRAWRAIANIAARSRECVREPVVWDPSQRRPPTGIMAHEPKPRVASIPTSRGPTNGDDDVGLCTSDQSVRSAAGMTPIPSGRRYASLPVVTTAAQPDHLDGLERAIRTAAARTSTSGCCLGRQPCRRSNASSGSKPHVDPRPPRSADCATRPDIWQPQKSQKPWSWRTQQHQPTLSESPVST